jgi:hypothetical protein
MPELEMADAAATKRAATPGTGAPVLSVQSLTSCTVSISM